MKKFHLKYIFISLIIILLQSTVVLYFSISNIVPDLLLIWIIFIAIKWGQIPGTIYGFGIGLIFDLVSGGFIGLSSLSKAISGFITGYFYNENRIEIVLGSYRFLMIVLLISIIHNLIYFLIFIQGSEISPFYALIRIGSTTALYTTTISILPVLLFARKYSFKV